MQVQSQGWGDFLGEGHSNPLHYSCLKNPMDRRAWWDIVHRITQSQTQEKQLSLMHHKLSLTAKPAFVAIASAKVNLTFWK